MALNLGRFFFLTAMRILLDWETLTLGIVVGEIESAARTRLPHKNVTNNPLAIAIDQCSCLFKVVADYRYLVIVKILNCSCSMLERSI